MNESDTCNEDNLSLEEDFMLMQQACIAIDRYFEHHTVNKYLPGHSQMKGLSSIVSSGNIENIKDFLKHQQKKADARITAEGFVKNSSPQKPGESASYDKDDAKSSKYLWEFWHMISCLLGDHILQEAWTLRRWGEDGIEALPAPGNMAKPELNRIKRERNEQIQKRMNRAIPALVRHLACHYFDGLKKRETNHP